jgi:hypothetical protein
MAAGLFLGSHGACGERGDGLDRKITSNREKV